MRTNGGTILITVDGETHEIDRETAVALQEGIEESLCERQEFFRTAGEHRKDGSYVVERRNAETTGNATVFESFDEARRLFRRLPDTFDADALSKTGITGSRRHMLVRHFAEHPAFPCELASRNPLRAQKKTAEGRPSVPASAD